MGVKESLKLARNQKKRGKAVRRSDDAFNQFKHIFIDCLQNRFTTINPIVSDYISHKLNFYSAMQEACSSVSRRLSDLDLVDDVDGCKERLFQTRINGISSLRSFELNSCSRLLDDNAIDKERVAQNPLMSISNRRSLIKSVRDTSQANFNKKLFDIPPTSNHKDNTTEEVVQRRVNCIDRRMTIESITNVLQMDKGSSEEDNTHSKKPDSKFSTNMSDKPDAKHHSNNFRSLFYANKGSSESNNIFNEVSPTSSNLDFGFSSLFNSSTNKNRPEEAPRRGHQNSKGDLMLAKNRFSTRINNDKARLDSSDTDSNDLDPITNIYSSRQVKNHDRALEENKSMLFAIKLDESSLYIDSKIN